MKPLIFVCLVIIGAILHADIPESDHEFYTSVMVWLFVALLVSIFN